MAAPPPPGFNAAWEMKSHLGKKYGSSSTNTDDRPVQKVAKKTGILLYIQEKMKQDHNYLDTKRAIAFYNPYWKNLPAGEKKRYDQMAKAWNKKNAGAASLKGKLTNTGQLIEEQVKLNKAPEEKILAEKTYREEMANYSRTDILNWPFFIVASQVLVDEREIGDAFVPVEVAIVKFNLARGILDERYFYPKPDIIQPGLKHAVKDWADCSHRIHYEEFQSFSSNYSAMWTNIRKFTGEKQLDGKQAPLYCHENFQRQNQRVMEWMCERDSGYAIQPFANPDLVFAVESLIQDLMGYLAKDGQAQSQLAVSWIKDRLSSSKYDYEDNMSCKFHYDIEVIKCALLEAKTIAYLIFDMLIGDGDAIVKRSDVAPDGRHKPGRSAQSASSVVTGTFDIHPPHRQTYQRTTASRGWGAVPQNSGYLQSNASPRFANNQIGGGYQVAAAAGGDEPTIQPLDARDRENKRFPTHWPEDCAEGYSAGPVVMPEPRPEQEERYEETTPSGSNIKMVEKVTTQPRLAQPAEQILDVNNEQNFPSLGGAAAAADDDGGAWSTAGLKKALPKQQMSGFQNAKSSDSRSRGKRF